MTIRTARDRIWPVAAIGAGVLTVGIIAAQIVAAAPKADKSTPAPPNAYEVTTVASDVPSGVGTVYPGGTGSLIVKFTNRTGVDAVITGMVGNGTPQPANCALSLHASGVNAWVTTSPTVPGKSTVTFTVSNALAMGTSAASSCQSALLTVPVAVTARNGK